MLGASPSLAKSDIAPDTQRAEDSEGYITPSYGYEPTPEQQQRLELERKGQEAIHERLHRAGQRSRLAKGHDPMDMDLAALKSVSPSWKVNIQVRRANDAQTMYEKLAKQWEDLRDKTMEMAEKFIADLIG
jgi:hypothetical protein